MYGDSLTEIWNASRGCYPYSVRHGFQQIMQKWFGPLAKPFGMSGEP